MTTTDNQIGLAVPDTSSSTVSFGVTAEELEWRTHLQLQYRHDAERAVAYMLAGNRGQSFIERLLELLRTYVETPGVGDSPQLADDCILQAAYLAGEYFVELGYWRQMEYLWSTLCKLAEFTGDASLYIDFNKYLAIMKGRQGDGSAGIALYRQIIHHPYFQAAPPNLQADILSHHATVLLWSGRRKAAAPLLQRCLDLTSNYAQPPDAQPPATSRPGPLWESRAYALNQQGVLAMFCGDFALAQQRFEQILLLFQEQGEDNNLACVAHQATGRLLLYEGKWAEAVVVLEKGLLIRKRRQEREGTAVNSIYIAAAHMGLHQYDLAHSLLGETLPTCRALDNQHDLALCHLYLGLLAWGLHQSDRATYHWQETVTIAHKAVLHFVEVRMLLRVIPALFCRGHFALVWSLLQLLWQSGQHDQLTPWILWRFLWI